MSKQYTTQVGSITTIAGRVEMDHHQTAPHVLTAQVRIPRFIESPVVVATVAGRSGDLDPFIGTQNPGKLVVVWDVNYNSTLGGDAYLTFAAANASEGEPIGPYPFCCEYIVVGELEQLTTKSRPPARKPTKR